jgi:hypothetical protein
MARVPMSPIHVRQALLGVASQCPMISVPGDRSFDSAQTVCACGPLHLLVVFDSRCGFNAGREKADE